MPPTVRMVPTNPDGTPAGAPVEVPSEEAQIYADRGYVTQDTGARSSSVIEGAREEYYTRPGAKVAAGVGALARTLSGGGSDALVRAFGSEQAREDLAALREYNKGLSTGVEIVGSVLPVGAAGLAARAGSKIASGIKGAGTLAKLARAGTAAGVEGVAAGFGEGVSQVALSDKPVDLERAISTIGSEAIFGGGVGGAAGTLGKAAEIGLKKARARLDLVRTNAAKQADIPEHLAGKTDAEYAELDRGEHVRLLDEQNATKASIVDDTAAYRQKLRDDNPFLVIEGTPKRDLTTTTGRIDEALKTPKSLAKDSGGLAKTLENQETLLRNAIESRDSIAAKLAEKNQKIASEVTGQLSSLAPDVAEIELSGKAMKQYGAFTDTRIPRDTKSLRVSRDDAARFADALQSGAVKGSEDAALGKLEGLLDANRNLQSKIEGTRIHESKLTSPEREAIRAARKAAAEAPRATPGIIEQAAQGSLYGSAYGAVSAIPFVGPALAPFVSARLARGASDLVFGKLGKATAEASARTAKAIDAFLSVAPKVAKPVPVLATKALSRVRYAAQTDKEREASARDKTLPELFKRRTAEIRSQTEYGPDGRAALRPAARQAIADRLSPIAAADPQAADKLETIAARRVEFLANKIPRRPDIGGMPLGPDKWQPSDLEMRAFARYAAAVEDPTGVIERLATGALNPEDAEAIRVVYPEIFAHIKQTIVERLPELTKTLPYNRRVALSIFTGVPVDPAMRPEIVGVLQSQFEEEPGSDGGMSAPKASPQFGSITKPEPTPAQSRSSPS